jgi:hypothetical protein
MKTTIIVTAMLLGSAFSANAAPLHSHSRAVSACIANQEAELAPVEQYRGLITSVVPAYALGTVNRSIDGIHTRCMPIDHRPTDWTDFLPPN